MLTSRFNGRVNGIILVSIVPNVSISILMESNFRFTFTLRNTVVQFIGKIYSLMRRVRIQAVSSAIRKSHMFMSSDPSLDFLKAHEIGFTIFAIML